MSQLFAEVAVNSMLPHRQTFSYAVPDGMTAQPGSAAYVPFGRKLLQGIIVEVHGTPVFSEPEKIRSIVSLVGTAPIIDHDRLALAQWLSREYLAPIYDCISLMLPPGFDERPLTFVRALIDEDEVGPHDLPARQAEALGAITGSGRVALSALRDAVSFGAIEPVVLHLERRGLVQREYELARPRISAKTVTMAALAIPADEARSRLGGSEPPRTSRRADLLERLLEKQRVSDDEAIRLAGSRANLERLIRTGSVRPDRDGHIVELAMSRDEALTEIGSLRHSARVRQARRTIELLVEQERELPQLRRERIATATTDWLAGLGIITLREETLERDPLAHDPVERSAAPKLLPAQESAANTLRAAIDAGTARTFLLHGVTGSGKTEVYLDALAHCIALNRRAIVLVPEIALTAQTVRRFRERFDRVAVLHSGLSDGERFDQWHGIADARYDVVIGSRSAIFAPQPNLGLIVIDEEHEWTYKQHDTQPRYHARAAALELARLKHAVLVLGSATPDMETFDRAQHGEHGLVSLPERVRPITGSDGARRLTATPAMPPISVVDLREELQTGNRSMFSRDLHAAVESALAAQEQVILFLNRRGLAGHVQCRDCGFVPQCASCFVALTFHRAYDRLICHQCNRQQRLAAACHQCGSPRIRLVGAGVEKVEAEAARAFPGARLLRWDRDATRGKSAHEQILDAFLRREADILIGTQMLAKGLDLPAVTVVGVVNADVGLHLPDFRAGERTFQILTQVAGRAGRGERPGRVIIQTYQPDHYAIEAAARYDYEGFAASELASRQQAGYPPYARLLRLSFGHTNPRYAREEAMRLQRALALRRAELGSDADVLGPSPTYIPRVRGRWRWQLLLRGREPAAIVRDFVLPPGWSVDVDPQALV